MYLLLQEKLIDTQLRISHFSLVMKIGKMSSWKKMSIYSLTTSLIPISVSFMPIFQTLKQKMLIILNCG